MRQRSDAGFPPPHSLIPPEVDLLTWLSLLWHGLLTLTSVRRALRAEPGLLVP